MHACGDSTSSPLTHIEVVPALDAEKVTSKPPAGTKSDPRWVLNGGPFQTGPNCPMAGIYFSRGPGLRVEATTVFKRLFLPLSVYSAPGIYGEHPANPRVRGLTTPDQAEDTRFMSSELFHRWAMSKEIVFRFPLDGDRGLLVVRTLGEGIYITQCPRCDRWLNIPHSGVERKKRPIERALYGKLPCDGCETVMIVEENGVCVKKWGTPKKTRKRKPRELQVPDETPYGAEDNEP